VKVFDLLEFPTLSFQHIEYWAVEGIALEATQSSATGLADLPR